MITEKKKRTQRTQILLLMEDGRPRTMLQIARETHIERATICRRIAELRTAGKVYKAFTSKDHLTDELAGYYTIYPQFFIN